GRSTGASSSGDRADDRRVDRAGLAGCAGIVELVQCDERRGSTDRQRGSISLADLGPEAIGGVADVDDGGFLEARAEGDAAASNPRVRRDGADFDIDAVLRKRDGLAQVVNELETSVSCNGRHLSLLMLRLSP